MALQASIWTICLFLLAVTGLTAVQLALWSDTTRHVENMPSMSWLLGLFLPFVGTVIFSGWVGVLLVSFGQFSLLNVSIASLVAAVALFLWKRPSFRFHFTSLDWTEWAIVILLLGSAVVYFRPHEYVLGGIDPGVYVNIAATAVRTGDFQIEDDWTATLAEFPTTTLREQPPQWRTRYLQFVGWYVDDQTPGQIIPQFFPYHSMLIAIGMSLGGLYAGLFVTPIWGVLSLTAVYYTGRQLFNPLIGLGAAILLAITPTHIYFARYPTTEPLTLLFVFVGLLAYQKLWDDAPGKQAWGALLGASFGAAFLTRIDLPVVAVLLIGFFVLVWWQKKWHAGWKTAVIVSAVMMLHAALSAGFLNAPYVWNTYGGVATLLGGPSLIILGIVGGLGTIGGLILIWRMEWRSFVESSVGQFLRGVPFRWGVVIAIIGLSLFAYFVRPIIQPPISYPSWPAGTEAFLLDGENWVRLGWYLTPLGIGLATVGLALIVRFYSLNRLGFFLTVGGLTIVQYVYRILNTPYHIYAMRRYVPIVIPVLMLFTAVALWRLYQNEQRWAKSLAIGLFAAMMAGLLYQARFVLPLRDLEGATEQLVALQSQIDPEAMLLINEPASSTFADTFGPPLRFIYGHDIATIRQTDNEAEAFVERLVAEAEKRPLQLLATAPIDDLIKDTFDLEPVAFVPIRMPKLLNTFTDYPSVNQTVYYGIELYTLTPQQNRESQADLETLKIDVGSIDTAYIVDGFYGKEPLPGEVTVRWTQETAVLEIPIQEADEVLIEVSARIFRPEGFETVPVVIMLDNEPIGEFTPSRDLGVYAFTTSIDTEESTTMLQFSTTPFKPSEFNGSNDQRELGFLLDWVQITFEE